jgi:D-alanyl-D-alanine carboxypeptidase (penicillin-binding protein 5/6)
VRKQTKPIYIGLLLVIILSVSTPAAARPQVTAESAVLIDVETGEILYEKNIHQRRSPASTTKIMTGILAIEEGNLEAEVTTSPRAAAEGGSSIYLSAGEKLKLRELVYGLLMGSGNDAAVAIAEHIAGSVSNFALLMNQKAREIGALHTTFKNPNGLPQGGHLTTAYDLAQITRYALQNRIFSKVVGTYKKRIPWPNNSWDRILTNTNKLLTRSEMVDGVKTGYTRRAGKCLVASATKNGRRLVSVVLKSGDIWQDSLDLLNYGFDSSRAEKVVEKGEVVKQITIKNKELNLQAAKDFKVVVSNNKQMELKKIIEIKDDLELPIKVGDRIGSLALCDQNNVLLGRVELVAADNIKPSTLKSLFTELASRIQAYF